MVVAHPLQSQGQPTNDCRLIRSILISAFVYFTPEPLARSLKVSNIERRSKQLMSEPTDRGPRRFTSPNLGSLAYLTATLILSWWTLSAADTGVSNHAPDISFYAGLGEACCGEDPHPVHGIVASDGGYIMVGKTAAPNGEFGGFAVKIGPPNPEAVGVFIEPNENASYRWAIQLQSERGAATFLNAASIADAVFLAGLHSDVSGNTRMYLAKHALSDGALIWSRHFGTEAGHGAIETIQITANGGLIAGGIVGAPAGGLEGFKSYGNPFGGEASIFYLSPAQVISDVAPERPTWTRIYAEHETVKTIRQLPGEMSGYVLLVGREGAAPTLIQIDNNGNTNWQQSYLGRFEATDVALHMINNEHLGYTFTGHGGADGTLDGQLTRVNLNGELIWAKSFGNPSGGVGPFNGLNRGNPQLIFDECWGVKGLPDGGTVVGCGTGIEGCDWVTPRSLREECELDPRRVWRGYVVRFNADGDTVWHRVDSFAEQGAENDVSDAASEYVVLMPNGGILSVVDQGFGIGLLGLEPERAANTEGSDQNTQQTPNMANTGESRQADEVSESHDTIPNERSTTASAEAHRNAEDGCSTSQFHGLSQVLFALMLLCWLSVPLSKD